jgi:two-component system sensor histidine kinase PilS (NtrC family)
MPFFSAQKANIQSKSRIEAIIKGEKGIKIHLGCSISPLKDKNEKQIGNILIFQDITEIKRMEENLEKSKRLALIGEMAAGLAHEMRNPLASITGSIELLKQGLNLEKTDKRLMQIILRGKNQLDSFVRDFLLLARPIPLSRELVDVNMIAEEVLENMKLSSEWSSKIKIMKVFSDNAAIFANRGQIRQIIHNLVLNAVQAMEKGGVLSVETALVKLDDKKEYAEIKITDTGCGIDQENLRKIFEPFFTNKDKGTGLGLTIVGRIVEGYSGKIKIESNINIGTSCAVWLPAKDENIQQTNLYNA